MKKVIRGLRYDTETATRVGNDSYSNFGDFQYWCEELYRTSTGNWFLYGEGGAKSKFAKAIGQNEIGGGNDITPLTRSDALAWLEAHNSDSDAIAEYFSDMVEDA